ncbi:Similar to NOF: 120.7 kDa protein in NOF-FB transposable element (Drosophila melanogaster) [Cotesia congregata]|uniref:Similar to NOF: 120.7 kDa protein in NOF-FB transposable element (Drosophila melanogaster) n=1 Tax=Cotesia congregata TaxID=51543 RepID=A0A8J2MST8_COTCN|nr:Similar to NOF: 120.7 kDa protein in NOF-FB transposable element (Drosophila melanogaster) [Cotesia congregata]
MLIICCTEYEDTVISYREEEITPRDARVELETLIGNRKIKVMVEDIEEKIKSMDIDSDKKDLLNDYLFSVSDDNLTIASWASHLTSYPTNILLTGNTLNCFYVPLFKDPLIKNVKEFPLWTKVCIPSNKLRPSSSYIEEDFKDLKKVLAKQITLPARIDIFVKVHLKYLLGDNNIDDCTMSIEDSNLHNEKFEEGVQNDEEFQDSLQNENWRGLGNDLKHAKNDWANYDNNDNQNDSDENSKADGTESEKLHSVLEIDEDEIEINLNNAIDKVSRKIKKEDYPEIKLINDLIKLKKNKENIPTIQKKGKHKETYLLINGNKRGPVLYQGIHYIAYNTCPLDSIIQILYNGALENQSFTDYLSSSKNPAFLLTMNLLKKGVNNNPKIYEERFSILHQFYKALEPSQKEQGAEEKNNKTTTVSRVIDCEDNVTSLTECPKTNSN